MDRCPPTRDAALDGRARPAIVARISYDKGQTLSRERNLWTGPAAYSDLTVCRIAVNPLNKLEMILPWNNL